MPGHLHDELASNSARVTVQTQFGPVTGGRAVSNAAAFLGALTCRLRLETGKCSFDYMQRYHMLSLPLAFRIQSRCRLSSGML
jgi:hypothetical protein